MYRLVQLSKLSAEARSLNSVDTQCLGVIDSFTRYAIGAAPQVNSRKNSLKAEDVPGSLPRQALHEGRHETIPSAWPRRLQGAGPSESA